MKVRELAERLVGNIDVSVFPPETIGLEGDKAWSACFEAFMRLLGDAEVIGLPCKTCGGKRFIAKPSGDLPDAGSTFTRCLECADTPVWLIAPERLEAGAKAWTGFDAPPDVSDDEYWMNISPEARECRCDDFCAALKAAGIVCADEYSGGVVGRRRAGV